MSDIDMVRRRLEFDDRNRRFDGMLNGRQFEQLPMFMSAREIKSQFQPNPSDMEMKIEGSGGRYFERRETADEMWDRKVDESHGLARHVAEHGVVDKPVHLAHEQPSFEGDKIRSIAGGHHRIAVMGEHDPDQLMPVLHHKDILDAAYGDFRFEQRDRPYPYS